MTVGDGGEGVNLGVFASLRRLAGEARKREERGWGLESEPILDLSLWGFSAIVAGLCSAFAFRACCSGGEGPGIKRHADDWHSCSVIVPTSRDLGVARVFGFGRTGRRSAPAEDFPHELMPPQLVTQRSRATGGKFAVGGSRCLGGRHRAFGIGHWVKTGRKKHWALGTVH